MDENELISKKELLQLTGISYGQLYRWKRENLIPEAWFVKKSSFTGQETFFPKAKVLKRTEMILEMKDQYSLEELRNIFSPESTNRIFKQSDFSEIKEIKNSIYELFVQTMGKENFNLIELAFMYITSKMNLKGKINEDEAKDLIRSIHRWCSSIKGTGYSLLLCKKEKTVFALLKNQDASLSLDEKTEKLEEIFLEEATKELNDKLNGL